MDEGQGGGLVTLLCGAALGLWAYGHGQIGMGAIAALVIVAGVVWLMVA